MTLTPGQRRSWARHGDREIQRTIDDAKAALAADAKAERARAKEARAARTARGREVIARSMPYIEIGDSVRLVTGAIVGVGRVNRMSFTSQGGVRYTADEILAVLRRTTP